MAPALLCLIAAAFAVRTWIRNTDWQDDLSLARATVRSSPKSYKGHTLLAMALYNSHADIDGVIAEAEAGLAPLWPLPDFQNYAPPYQQAGLFYLVKGDGFLKHDAQGKMSIPPEALRAYQRARAILERSDEIVQGYNRREAAGTKPVRYADLYRLLSQVELRLGDTPRALDRAQYALSLSPFASPMYLQLADVLLHTGRPDEAAVALMEGEIVTNDPGLRDQLVHFYQSGLDTQGCATAQSGGQWMLNPNCELVHRHLCEGSMAAEQVYTAAGRADLAAGAKDLALHKLNCAP